MRKERSGSRGKPIPTSAGGIPLFNPTLGSYNVQSEQEQDIRMLKTKAKNLEYVF